MWWRAAQEPRFAKAPFPHGDTTRLSRSHGITRHGEHLGFHLEATASSLLAFPKNHLHSPLRRNAPSALSSLDASRAQGSGAGSSGMSHTVWHTLRETLTWLARAWNSTANTQGGKGTRGTRTWGWGVTSQQQGRDLSPAVMHRVLSVPRQPRWLHLLL